LNECKFPIILGYDWLFLHNPVVDWQRPSLTFSRCICNGLPSSVPILGEPLSLKPPSGPFRTPLPAAIRPLSSNEVDEDDSDDDVDDFSTISALLPSQYVAFADVFSERKANLLPEHRPFDCSIDLTDPNAIPPTRPIYALTPLEVKALDQYLDENLAKGFIRSSRSPAGAPIFFVAKKSGELRPCVDYRGLNALTIKNRGAIPLIADLLDRLGTARYFSKIDLRGAYNLVRIKPGDEWKTAFRCHRGHFEYCVMPFGLTNAPAIFQQMMQTVFSDILNIFVIIYLDDILIFSMDIDSHRAHVAAVLTRLRTHSLYAKLSKCAFDQDNVEFLGHSISSAGISPLPEKVSSVVSWPTPTCLTELQSFIGFCNYYRRFIRAFSQLALPLTNLTRKDAPFLWTPECVSSFAALKQALTTGPVLRHADPLLPFVVETDASNFAVGAVLAQPSSFNASVFHPVAFYSRKLDSAERNYDVHDKELLAIICAFEHWRHYLIGSPFVIDVQCDHRNLTFFQTRRVLKSRHARWVTRLSPFQFRLLYRPGILNTAADALSRRVDFFSKEGDAEATEVDSSILLHPDIFVDSIAIDPLPSSNQRQTVVSEEEKRQILTSRHSAPSAGHLGRTKTFDLIARDFYWVGMRKDIDYFVDSCGICQRNKSPRHKPFGLLQPLPIPPRPWSSISMDFIVKLPSSNGFDSILVIVCRLTKQAHFIACNESINSSGLADLFIANVFRLHGLPDDIISDRGPVFRSLFWKTLLSKLNVVPKYSTAYHPQTDGQTERVNQTLEQYLRCYVCFSQDNWVYLLPFAEFAYNNSVATSTRHSPFFSNYGFHPKMDLLVDSNSNLPAISSHLDQIKSLQKVLQEELQLAQEKMKTYADRSRIDHSFKVGDFVWLLNRNIRTTRPSKKLDHKRLGPFQLIERINDVTFRLELPSNIRLSNTFHVSLLEPTTQAFMDNYKTPQPIFVDDHEEFEVEKILDHKVIQGLDYFLVKWSNYDDANNTWEPSGNLTNAADIVQEFLNSRS
jgi:hypothetical protein